MSDEEKEKKTESGSGWAADFRKQVPVLLMVILTSLATSWWNSQKAQGDLVHRVEKVEEKSETNAKNIAQNAQTSQQNAIKLAEIAIIQSNGLDQIKDLKQQISEIKLTSGRK